MPLSVVDMFRYPTVRSMARHLGALQSPAAAGPAFGASGRLDRTAIHQQRRRRAGQRPGGKPPILTESRSELATEKDTRRSRVTDQNAEEH